MPQLLTYENLNTRMFSSVYLEIEAELQFEITFAHITLKVELILTWYYSEVEFVINSFLSDFKGLTQDFYFCVSKRSNFILFFQSSSEMRFLSCRNFQNVTK